MRNRWIDFNLQNKDNVYWYGKKKKSAVGFRGQTYACGLRALLHLQCWTGSWTRRRIRINREQGNFQGLGSRLNKGSEMELHLVYVEGSGSISEWRHGQGKAVQRVKVILKHFRLLNVQEFSSVRWKRLETNWMFICRGLGERIKVRL